VSKLLRQLLGESDDPMFAIGLSRLEDASGRPGIDARLTADILAMARSKTETLGLDPHDTTGAELYAALSTKVLDGESYLRAYLGHPANFDAGHAALAGLIGATLPSRQTWGVKHSVLKKILVANPPKKVMKSFHYQSVDSMVKRFDVAECMLAARVVESKTWWDKTKKAIALLGTKDFEITELSVVRLNSAHWPQLIADWQKVTGHGVIMSKECGVVGYGLTNGAAPYLTTLMYALHAVNEVILYGTYLKLHFVSPSIGNVLVHAMDDGELMHSSLSGTRFHWRDVQRYFGVYALEGEVQFVHLDITDLGWLQIETAAAVQVPELGFWLGLDFVGVAYTDGKIISCSVLDCALSVHVGRDYKDMYLAKMQRALRSELMARYVAIPVSRALVLKQFDISGITEENW
jgi:hypothetical protein